MAYSRKPGPPARIPAAPRRAGAETDTRAIGRHGGGRHYGGPALRRATPRRPALRRGTAGIQAPRPEYPLRRAGQARRPAPARPGSTAAAGPAAGGTVRAAPRRGTAGNQAPAPNTRYAAQAERRPGVVRPAGRTALRTTCAPAGAGPAGPPAGSRRRPAPGRAPAARSRCRPGRPRRRAAAAAAAGRSRTDQAQVRRCSSTSVTTKSTRRPSGPHTRPVTPGAIRGALGPHPGDLRRPLRPPVRAPRSAPTPAPAAPDRRPGCCPAPLRCPRAGRPASAPPGSASR